MTGTTTTSAAPVGVVYLLHFDRPYRHAAHYTGWTTDLPARLAEHAAGRGARLLAVITAAGIGWQLARTWPGTRERERAIKRQGGAARRCPLCKPTTGTTRATTDRPSLNEQDPDTIPVTSAHLTRSEEANRQHPNHIGILLDNQTSMRLVGRPSSPLTTANRRNIISLIASRSVRPEADISRSADVNDRRAPTRLARHGRAAIGHAPRFDDARAVA